MVGFRDLVGTGIAPVSKKAAVSGDRASGNCISGGPPYNKVCIFRMSR